MDIYPLVSIKVISDKPSKSGKCAGTMIVQLPHGILTTILPSVSSPIALRSILTVILSVAFSIPSKLPFILEQVSHLLLHIISYSASKSLILDIVKAASLTSGCKKSYIYILFLCHAAPSERSSVPSMETKSLGLLAGNTLHNTGFWHSSSFQWTKPICSDSPRPYHLPLSMV